MVTTSNPSSVLIEERPFPFDRLVTDLEKI